VDTLSTLTPEEIENLRTHLKLCNHSLPAAARQLGYSVSDVAAALVTQYGSTRSAAAAIGICYVSVYKFLPTGFKFPNYRGGRPLGSTAPRRSPKLLANL